LTGPEQGKWFTRLDTVQANLRRATEHAAHDPDGTEQVFRFGVALWRYWMARDREQEAVALLLPVLDRPEARADPELFAKALSTAALAARSIDIAAALRLGEQAVKLARQLGTSQLLIESLAALSYVCYLAREPERGLPWGREAVEGARQLGDDVLLGESLVAYLLCDALIDPAHARPLFTEAIACTQRSGDHLIAYFLTNYAGAQALRAGDIPAARAQLQQAAQAIGPSGAKPWTCRSTWAGCCARTMTPTVRDPASRQPCGSAVATGIVSVSPTPASAWRAWPRTPTTGTARLRSTGERKPSSTELDNRGENLKRATARTASTRCAPASARSNSSEPTPEAWRSPRTRSSTWSRKGPPSLIFSHNISARYALWAFSVVQLRLGELTEAGAGLKRALAITEAAYGPDNPQVALALNWEPTPTVIWRRQATLGKCP
jgi:tetratricopeptide (TPR) repeat protein